MMSLMRHHQRQALKKQRGNILVMFTIGLFALIVMAALALDGGHLLLNKSRLQNIADAAALHAAKVMDEGGSHLDARKATVEIIALNLAHRDKFEISDALLLPALADVANSIDITAALQVDFSMRPDPFESSMDQAAHYVKVEISNLQLNNFLADIFNFDKRVTATALAGKSTEITFCPSTVVPMLVCGDPSTPETGSLKPDTTDDYNLGHWGLDFDTLYATKIGSGETSLVGPGNFQLVDLGGNASDIKFQMAGAVRNDSCDLIADITDGVETATGNKVGLADGINTRLGIFFGNMKQYEDQFSRDSNICQGEERIEAEDIDYAMGVVKPESYYKAYRFSDYKEGGDNSMCAEDTSSTAKEEYGRRIFNIVIADCGDGNNNGTSTLDYLGLGCVFLTQSMEHSGDAHIIAEIIEGCPLEGKLSGIAEDNPGPYKIVLYHVPDSKDS
ncbi:pilus assembly protein TadG-related protein [Psychromonas hadalis]|uniref:pilus assembly protein TadG-related protein n=1 Tax=Psychromonas hadalis TaxID=211669 RepID=UPI0003B73881|nr:pilus assembly protein TadG-related protein [Psychromonas hadalis]